MRMNKMQKLKAIWELIGDFKSKIGAQASGHFYTAISVLEAEGAKLEKEIEDSIEFDKALAKVDAIHEYEQRENLQ